MNLEELKKEFLKDGFSEELSEYLANHYPKTGFGGGWLSDDEVDNNYKKWLNESINNF